MTRVLLSPDKFKGSLDGPGVAAALARGIAAIDPELDLVELPVADGGDGTCAAAVAAGFEAVPVTVRGPTGAAVAATWARRGDVAVVEMADACGLARLPDGPAPLTATSRGLGEVVAAALDAGARRVVLGIGGSASTDGGAGMLAALGARLLDRSGHRLPEGGAALTDLATLDLSDLHPGLAAADLVVACDVDTPLTGPDGAAAVYGPQKGATTDDVALLDTALDHWADVVARTLGRDDRATPGGGAAGGVGYAAMTVLGAQLRPGIELVLELLDFDTHVAGADLVITGEGSLDAQSLHGKAPVGVATAARRHGVPVVAVCGRLQVGGAALRAAGITAAYPLTDVEPDPVTCMREPARLLAELAARLVAHLRV